MNQDHSGGYDRRSVKDSLRHAIACDDARASMPYEHCATLSAGIALIVGALLTPRRELAVAQGAAAGFLLYRSLSGRDGVRKWVDADRARPRQDGPPSTSADTDSVYTGA